MISINRLSGWVGLAIALAVGFALAPTSFAQDQQGAAAAPVPGDAGNRGARGNFGGGGGQATYPFQYRLATVEQITEVLDRVHAYADANSASRMVNRQTGETITDFSKPNPDAVLEQKTFNLTGYEWGVTYAGMVLAADATGDARFKDYVAKRFQIFADVIPAMRAAAATQPANRGGGAGGGRGGRGGGRGGGAAFGGMLNPNTLDASGAMCAALIKARRANIGPDLMSQIDVFMDWISNKQFRFSDKTLARQRPHPETLWLDDLYMSVPALAQMGKLTGDKKYYDDACRQILQFGARMFVPEKMAWMHGWTTNTDDHPAFYWARANGWAVMAMAELLDVLPEDHPQRADILKLFRAQVKGLAQYQSGDGLWHQLLDRDDSYLETSASAMFVFAMARGVNRGWINAVTYGPIAQVGWQAVAAKVNAQGGVEGTCVGTDLAFDAAYYYHRPVSVNAAHGYGPVLLAGAEMINMVKNKTFHLDFGVIHQGETTPQNGGGRGFGGGGRGQ